jgi:tRNA-2-methylthio-N6-dimethylallyladenosine synthase
MNRVYIKTYGCQMNERDSNAVAAMLRKRGYSIVDAERDADVVLLNTCAVRDKAEQKAIGKTGYLAKRKRSNADFIIGILGCMAQNRGTDLLDRLPDLDLLVGTQKFHRVPDHLDNIIAGLRNRGPVPDTVVDLGEEEGSQNTIREHHEGSGKVSAFVSIMQGCNMNCTFCIVPKTRGKERCRSIADVVEEVQMLAAGGTREVTLLGQIVTSYGRREIPFVNGKSPFVQLLEAVHAVDGIERIRFTSPHPRGFKDDLIEAYRTLPKLCHYVHLPVQSGSNRILRAMNRPYSRERYLKIVDDLRAAAPDMYLSTDIIVGFPGETDADFALTCDLFEQVGYEMAYIFKYSTRTGTPAVALEGQVPKAIKEERNRILLEKLATSSLRRNRSLIGTTQEILVEGPARRGEGLFIGRTPGNRKAVFPARERLIGELVQIRVENATTSTLHGSLVLQGLLDDPSEDVALNPGEHTAAIGR